jgi:hypothetical protein
MIGVTLWPMGRLRSRWVAVEVPVLVAALAVGACVVIAGVVFLWWRVGGNVAGWVTTFVVIGLAFLLAEVVGAGEAFSAASKPTQRTIIVGALVLAAAGSGAYVLWPGTTSWYLSALPAIPILLVLDWLRGDEESESGQPAEFTDGPWTAP